MGAAAAPGRVAEPAVGSGTRSSAGTTPRGESADTDSSADSQARDPPPGAHGTGAAMIGLSRIWAQSAAVVVMLAVVARLDPQSFGVFAVASAAYTALAILAGQGIYEYILKTRDDAVLPTACGLVLIGTTLAVLAGLGLAVLLPGLLAEPSLGDLLMALLPVLYLTAAATVMEGVQLRDGRLKMIAVISMTAETGGVLAAIAGLWWDAGVFALVWQRVAREGLMTGAHLLHGRWTPRFGFSRAVAADAIGFARPLLLTRGVANAGPLALLALMGMAMSVAEVGIFRLAQRVVLLAWDVFYQPLRASLWSRLPAIPEGDPSFGRTTLGALESFGLGMFAMQMVIATTAGGAIVLLLGPPWAPAAGVVVALALGRMAAVFSAPAEAVLAIQGRGDIVLGVSLANLAVSALAVGVGSAFGLQAVAFGIALATSLVALAAALATSRTAGIPPSRLWDLAARLIVCALVMAAGAWVANRASHAAGLDGWPALVGSLIVATACYTVAAWRLLPGGTGDYWSALARAGSRMEGLLPGRT